MPNTIFIDTNKLQRKQTPEGEFTEILNNELVHRQSVSRRCLNPSTG